MFDVRSRLWREIGAKDFFNPTEHGINGIRNFGPPFLACGDGERKRCKG